MGITLRHDAAGLPVSGRGGSSKRKYGMDLVMRQQQAAQDAAIRQEGRYFDLAKEFRQNNRADALLQGQQQREDKIREAGEAREDKLFNKQRANVIKDRETARLQKAEDDLKSRNLSIDDAYRDRIFKDADRQQGRRWDLDDREATEQRQMEQENKQRAMELGTQEGIANTLIEQGEYEKTTGEEILKTFADERSVLGNERYNATQMAEAIGRIRARRQLLMAQRMNKDTTANLTGRQALRSDAQLRDKYYSVAQDELGADGSVPSRGDVVQRAIEIYEEEQQLLRDPGPTQPPPPENPSGDNETQPPPPPDGSSWTDLLSLGTGAGQLNYAMNAASKAMFGSGDKPVPKWDELEKAGSPEHQQLMKRGRESFKDLPEEGQVLLRKYLDYTTQFDQQKELARQLRETYGADVGKLFE